MSQEPILPYSPQVPTTNTNTTTTFTIDSPIILPESPFVSSPPSPQLSSSASSSINPSNPKDEKPSFHYDLELFTICKHYLDTKNHHGLALITRQKGVPPFLRFKIWPILLKYHPFVLNPFLQPDEDLTKGGKNSHGGESSSTSGSAENSSNEEAILDDEEEEIKLKIKKDLKKYIQRLKYSSNINVSSTEKTIFNILEHSILKFSLKWGEIIKYDSSLTWMALNLAEWFPPIPNSSLVLMGRDHSSSTNSLTIDLFDDYSNYIDNIPWLKDYLHELIQDDKISNLSFHDVYERLVLVLLHCPPKTQKKKDSKKTSSSSMSSHTSASPESNVTTTDVPQKVNKSLLPLNGGTIEERVSFFIYSLRKVLPELSQFFHEEQILTKFGSQDDEWLIWWLKFCGSKVWSKFDRGRIWDLLLGWRLKNPKKDLSYYYDKLEITDNNFLTKLGPDIFWSLSSNEENNNNDLTSTATPLKTREVSIDRRNSLRDLVSQLNNDLYLTSVDETSEEYSRRTSSSSANSNSTTASTISSVTSSNNATIKKINLLPIPFSRLDAHVELIFVSLALLKSKENLLVELDQHEIRQILSRLPTKSIKYKHKKHHVTHQSQQQQQQQQQQQPSDSTTSSPTSTSPSTSTSPKLDIPSPVLEPGQKHENIIISNDSINNHKVNFIDNIITEAGELWRKWLWYEMVEDN